MDNAFAATPAVGAQFSCGNGPLCCTRRARAVIRFLLDEKKTKKEKRGCEEEKRKAKQDHRLALFLLSSYQARNRRDDEDFHRGTGYESHAFTHSGRHQGKRARQAAESGARSFEALSPIDARLRRRGRKRRLASEESSSSTATAAALLPLLGARRRQVHRGLHHPGRFCRDHSAALRRRRPLRQRRCRRRRRSFRFRVPFRLLVARPRPRRPRRHLRGLLRRGFLWKRGARLLRVYRGREGRAGGFVRPPGALRPRRPERGRRRNSSSSAKDSALRPASPRRGQRRRGRLHGAGSAQGRPEETRRGGGGGSEAKKGF